MPRLSREFVKIETRLLNDPRLWITCEFTQLLYFKLLIIAKLFNNKIPKSMPVLKGLLRTEKDDTEVKAALERLKVSFPKFNEGKYFYFFKGFSERFGNYVPVLSPYGTGISTQMKMKIKKKTEKGHSSSTCKTTSKTVNDILKKAKGGNNV